MRKLILGFAVAQALTSVAHAQTAPPTEAAASAAACCTIPALTEIKIEIGATINSQTNRIGEHFPIRLTDPIVVDGKTIVPAGATGQGDIVHAAKSRFGGKAGELLLAVRYIEHQGVRIPLRSLRYVPMHGKSRVDEAAAVAIAVSSVLAFMMTGGEVNIPAGTHAVAKTAAEVVVAPLPVAPASQQEGSTPK
jgi:hypothetical protein